jgi:hypothetical protein
MAIDYDDPAVIQDAKDKLAEMYSKADRQGRIDIGRLLGYDKARTNPDSARRSAERLATFRVGKGSKLDVTRYFKDLVTQDDPVAWTGELPFITLERGEFYYLVGYVGFLQENVVDGTLSAFDGFITPTLKSRGNLKGHAKGINQVRELFEEFNDVVQRIFDGTFQDEGDSRLSNDYAGIVAIGISREGVDEIEERAGRITKTRPDVYGVTLISSAVRFTKTKRKKDRKAIARSRASSREFPNRPKGRRKEIIQKIRRSYAQRSRFYD